MGTTTDRPHTTTPVTKQVRTEVKEPPKADCSLVRQYNWNTRVAYAICMAESSGNPRAYNENTNGSTDRGLMQINSIHADLVHGDVQQFYKPKVNMDIAYKLYKERGFRPWTTYNKGMYKRFL